MTIRTRLGALVGLAMGLGAAISWENAATHRNAERANDIVERLAAAEAVHQDASTQLAAALADTLAGLLGDDRARARALANRRGLELTLARLPDLDLPASTESHLEAAHAQLLAWADETVALGEGPSLDPSAHAVTAARLTRGAADVRAHMDAVAAELAADRVQAGAAAYTGHRAMARRLAIHVGLAVLVVCASIAGLGYMALADLQRLKVVAGRLAQGELTVRLGAPRADEIGDLGRLLNEIGENLGRLAAQREAEADRMRFAGRLSEGLEMAESEADVVECVKRALAGCPATSGSALLLADTTRAKLRLVTPGSAAACDVESPWACVAIRRASPMLFTSSTELDACPRLAGHPPCSASCVPVTFAGRAIGVLRTTGRPGEPPDATAASRLATTAAQAGARLGALRAMGQARLQATTDSLTGLLNRRALETRAPAPGSTYALLLCDLDHFKELNDAHGHQAGDQALRCFAQLVRAQLREVDTGCRYGGEEFLVVLADCAASDAAHVAERLREAAARPQSGGTPRFTASFGVADSTMAPDFESVLRAADAALYEAKRGGRNRVAVASAGHFTSAN